MHTFRLLFQVLVWFSATAIVALTLAIVILLVIYLTRLTQRRNQHKWKWASVSSVDRRSNLSYDDFVREYACPGKPVIITDATKNWAALKKWTPDFFRSHYGSIEWKVHDCETNLSRSMPIADYIDYLSAAKRDRLLYLSQWSIFSHPELYDDYNAPFYFRNWLERLPRKIQRKFGITYSTIYIGPKGTGTKLHIDNRNTSAWLAMISGRKRFIFFSPDQEEFLYDGAVDAFNPDLEKFPLYANTNPVEVILEPGELVYFPSKWWHQVENLTDSIAISHNLLDEWNSEIVLQSAFDESPIKAHIFQLLCEFPWLGMVFP